MRAARKLVGFHPVREQLRRDPRAVARVLVETRRAGQWRREVEALCRAAGVPFEGVSAAELARFAPGVSNGFAAELADLPARADEKSGDPGFVVLAEDVQDPRNLGALLRVCEGAGVGRVLVRERGSAPLSESAVKASAGAAAWLAVESIGSAAQELERLKRAGFWIYGLAMEGDPPWEVDLAGDVVICVGGEEHGLRRLTRETCDRLIGLPMLGRVESLNLATAAAAVLYEAVRQRRAAARALSPGATSG